MAKYWDIERTASHNCMFNFIKGIRGCGKTYGLLKRSVERHIKKGYNFLYLRRTEEELKTLTTQKNGRLFNHVQTEFEGHSLWCEANVLHMDKEVIGYAQALSTAGKMKSDAIVNVRDIIFDEYLINTRISKQRYLQDEVTAFLELYETIARPGSRDYEVTCWFLGNAVTSTDPYSDFFDLRMPYKSEIWKQGECLVQLVAPPDLVEAKKSTRFYKALHGTSYEAYATENKFLLDNDNFIKRKGREAEYQFTILYYDDMIGVWRDYRNGRYFISENVDKQCRTVFAVTTEDHEPNTLLLKGARQSTLLKQLKTAYDLGCVYYESQKLYNWFRDVVRMGL